MPKRKPSEPESFRERLNNACRGLNFISETDSRVTTVFGGASPSNSAADILNTIAASSAGNVETRDVAKFFSRLTTKKEWYNVTQNDNAEKFRDLESLLDAELTDLNVFRVGKIRLTYYVLGRDREGNVAGVKMAAIET